MYRAKILITVLLLLLTLLTGGCVRGDIVLDISRTGSAELSSKVMVISLLKDNLKPVKEQFAKDGFEIMDVRESGMEGFHAVRNFSSISDMKDLSIFKGINVQDALAKDNRPNSTIANQPASPPKLIVEKGIFFNTYKINVDIDLGSQYGLAQKDDSFIVKNILSQVNLTFALKLPTKTIKNNAYQVSEDGRMLIWRLALGENNQIVAEARMLNLVNIGIMLGLALCIIGYIMLKRSGLFAKYFMK